VREEAVSAGTMEGLLKQVGLLKQELSVQLDKNLALQTQVNDVEVQLQEARALLAWPSPPVGACCLPASFAICHLPPCCLSELPYSVSLWRVPCGVCRVVCVVWRVVMACAVWRTCYLCPVCVLCVCWRMCWRSLCGVSCCARSLPD